VSRDSNVSSKGNKKLLIGDITSGTQGHQNSNINSQNNSNNSSQSVLKKQQIGTNSNSSQKSKRSSLKPRTPEEIDGKNFITNALIGESSPSKVADYYTEPVNHGEMMEGPSHMLQ
jgi:hypothetical protein